MTRNPITVRIKSDLSGMDRLEARLPGRLESSVREAAEALAADIRSNWSASSPSSPGNPPAIDTGNLDSAVRAEPTGRDVLGRFARTSDAAVWFVRIATSEGDDPRNRGEYGTILEYGLNRPFVEPAVDRLAGVYSHFFRALFDDSGFDGE
jgi:hypothetical protein